MQATQETMERTLTKIVGMDTKGKDFAISITNMLMQAKTQGVQEERESWEHLIGKKKEQLATANMPN